MDWINQNRLKTGFIIALLVLNLVTVSVIWMQMAQNRAPVRSEQPDRRPSESAGVMKSALDLTDEQTARLRQMLADYREQTRPDNDRLVVLKRRLADGLFTGSSDTAGVSATAKEIGETQTRIEMSRFRYFREFLAICTPAQQEKLRPILLELFGRKPPREEPGAGARQDKAPKQNEPKERESEKMNAIPDAGGQAGQARPEPLLERGSPPSVAEKASKYSARLKLSAGQEKQVREIFQASRRKGEELRKRRNPDPGTIEEEKAKIKQEEDRRIREILNAQQQSIFEEMTENRERPPR